MSQEENDSAPDPTKIDAQFDDIARVELDSMDPKRLAEIRRATDQADAAGLRAHPLYEHPHFKDGIDGVIDAQSQLTEAELAARRLLEGTAEMPTSTPDQDKADIAFADEELRRAKEQGIL